MPPAPNPSSFELTVDHVVIFSKRRPETTEALYGEIGLSCLLRKRVPERFAEMTFFRVGDMLIEVVHPFRKEPSTGEGSVIRKVDSGGIDERIDERKLSDKLFGVAFRCPSIEGIRKEIGKEFVIMETRRGIKPGTLVASVHKPPVGIPILLLEKEGGLANPN